MNKTYYYLDVTVYDDYHTIEAGTVLASERPDDIAINCKQYDFFLYFLDSEKELNKKMEEILEIFND